MKTVSCEQYGGEKMEIKLKDCEYRETFGNCGWDGIPCEDVIAAGRCPNPEGYEKEQDPGDINNASIQR